MSDEMKTPMSTCNICGVSYVPATANDLPPRLREYIARLSGRDPAAIIKDPGTCSRCTHDAQRAAMRAEYAKAAEERRREETRAILEIVPRHFRDAAADGIGGLAQARVANPAAVDAARGALGGPMVLIHGHAGSGKTTLAAAMLGELVQRAIGGDAAAARLVRGAVWVTAAELVRARAAHKLGDGEAPAVQEAMAATLLIIDDLGQERGGDRDGALADTLWARHENERACVFTTHLGGKEIAATYGSGFLRRLSETGHAVVINCAATQEAAA